MTNNYALEMELNRSTDAAVANASRGSDEDRSPPTHCSQDENKAVMEKENANLRLKCRGNLASYSMILLPMEGQARLSLDDNACWRYGSSTPGYGRVHSFTAPNYPPYYVLDLNLESKSSRILKFSTLQSGRHARTPTST